jgi:hypothetical protein
LWRNGKWAKGLSSGVNNSMIDTDEWCIAHYSVTNPITRSTGMGYGATEAGGTILNSGQYATMVTLDFDLTDKERQDLTNYIIKRIAPKGLGLTTVKIPLLSRATVSPAVTYLNLPSPYGADDNERSQQVHPSWLDAEIEIGSGQTWFSTGYRYIQCNTPFPRLAPGYGQPDIFENPCIMYSNDKTTWVTVAGYTNPIFPHPGGSAYNSDVDIYYDSASGRIYMHWREYFVSGGTDELRYMSSYTENGITWSAKYQMFFKDIVTDPLQNILSCNRFYDERIGKYVMYGIQYGEGNTPTQRNILVRFTPSDTIDGFDGSFEACNMPYNIIAASGGPWHQETRPDSRVANGHEYGYVHIFSNSNSGTSSGVMRLQIMTSIDGIEFHQYSTILLDASGGIGVTWDGEATYRPSFIKTASGYAVLYSAFGWPTDPDLHRLAHTGLVEFNI